MAHRDISDPSFPERLTKLRKRAGLSKADLAERAEVHERTIHNWERGAQERALESSLDRVAAVLAVSPRFLLHGRRWLRRAALAAVGVAVVGLAAYAGVRGLRDAESEPARPNTAVVAAPVTASSPLVYRDYVAGCENLKRLYRDEARAAFHRAVQRDSTFAMGWAMLAHPELWTTKDEYTSYANKAEALAANCTEKERLMIATLRLWTCNDFDGCVTQLEDLVERYPDEAEAYRLLARHYWTRRDCANAVACLKAAVAVDPTDGMSHNRLAYYQVLMGDIDAALVSVNRYRELAPWEANPYDTMGDILRRAGRWEESMAAYREALARKHDFAPSLQNLGRMHTLKGEWPQAEAFFAREMEAADIGARSRARLFMACVPAHAGRFDESLSRLETAMAGDLQEGFTGGPYLDKLRVKALLHWEMGDTAAAMAAWDKLFETVRAQGAGEVGDWTADYVMMLAHVDPDAAARHLETVDAHVAKWSPSMDFVALGAHGWLDLARGDAAAAREHLERAREHSPFFSVLYPLAIACERTGEHAEAIAALNESFSYCSNHIFYGPWVGKSRYMLAMDLKAIGRHHESRAELEKFVALWGEADHGSEELSAAREALGVHDVSGTAPGAAPAAQRR